MENGPSPRPGLLRARVASLLVLAGLLAGAVPASAQCTLGTLYQFTPQGSPTGFGEAGFADSLALYEVSGVKRVVVRENYGYSVFSAANPPQPVLIGVHNVAMESGYEVAADGFESTTVVAAAPDGSRLLLGYKEGTPTRPVLLMRPMSDVFTFGGEFPPTGSQGLVLDKVGDRYIGYSTARGYYFAAEATNFLSGSNPLPVSPVAALSGAAGLDRANVLGGTLNDHFLVAALSDRVYVIDGSAPGPAASIASGLVIRSVPLTAFGFPAPSRVSPAVGVHPVTGKQYVAGLGTSTTGDVLGLSVLSSTDGFATYVRVGNGIPYVPTGYTKGGGPSSFIATGDDLLLLTWSIGGGGGVWSKLTTISINAWDSPAQPAGVDMSPNAVLQGSSAFLSAFSFKGYASGQNLYLYVAAHYGSFAIPMNCVDPPRLLTVTKPGTGAGVVTSNPAGIDCGVTCSFSFDHGTAVVLTAAASGGSIFTGWSGEGCTGAGTCSVSMTQARNVTATFERAPVGPGRLYTVTPCRLADTRDSPAGPYAGPALEPNGALRVFPLAGRCGVPANAIAAALNLTITQAGSAGSLTMYPGDETPGTTSALSFAAGRTRANNAVLKLSGDGAASVGVRNDAPAQVHLVVDVSGYYAP